MSYSLLTTRHGLFLAEDRDMISKILKVYGEWSEKSVQLLASLIREGDRVVDVGANIGTFSIPLAKAVGGEGSVLCFEPQQRVFYNLCANVLLNNCEKVEARNILIADRITKLNDPYEQSAIQPGKPMINRGAASYVNALNKSASMPLQEQLITISTLDEELKTLHHCELIKIDVEGAEDLVLAGGEATIKQFRPLLYLECRTGELFEKISNRLRQLSYKLYWHPSLHYNPENFFQAGDLLGNRGDLNLLCLPEEKTHMHRAVENMGLHQAEAWTDVSKLFPDFEY